MKSILSFRPTKNKFFKFGRQIPAVVVSLFPRNSKVCNLDSLDGSKPVTDVISLAEIE